MCFLQVVPHYLVTVVSKICNKVQMYITADLFVLLLSTIILNEGKTNFLDMLYNT